MEESWPSASGLASGWTGRDRAGDRRSPAFTRLAEERIGRRLADLAVLWDTPVPWEDSEQLRHVQGPAPAGPSAAPGLGRYRASSFTNRVELRTLEATESGGLGGWGLRGSHLRRWRRRRWESVSGSSIRGGSTSAS